MASSRGAGIRKAWGSRTVLLAAMMVLAACQRQDKAAPYAPELARPAASTLVEYKFGVVPMANFQYVYEVYHPIVDYLNANLQGVKLVLEIPRGLGEHEKKLTARSYAIALSNPYQTLKAVQDNGYHVFAKLGDDSAFRGIWLVRRDSNIHTVADLKGKKIGFPPRMALAATMMTQLDLHRQGIDLKRDVEVSYSATQDSSIMQVYLKNVAAGATWPLAWTSFQAQHPAEASQMEVRFPTAPLVNLGLVARDDLPPALVERIGVLLASLHTTPAGRALLERLHIDRFERADDARYEVVKDFMARYLRAFPAPDA